MKLKQRAIMMASLSGTMIVLFLIGIQLGGPDTESENDSQYLNNADGVEEPKRSTREEKEEGDSRDSLDDIRLKESEGGMIQVDGDRREFRAPMPPPGGLDLRYVPRRFHPQIEEQPFQFRDPPRPGHHPNGFPKFPENPQQDFNPHRNPDGFPLDELQRKLHLNDPKFAERLRENDRKLQETDDDGNKKDDYQNDNGRRKKDEEEEEEEEKAGIGIKQPLQISPEVAKRDPWKIWRGWVKTDWFYPEGAFWSEEMNHILNSLATKPVTEFGLGYKGTQLKTSLFLGREKQRTSFKPMRYPRSHVIEGNPYAGFDRHNGEIAGFHLDGILNFRIAPPVVGRRVNLTALKPVTTEGLSATYFEEGGNTCFYGKCHYCRKEEAACADGVIMEGAVTLWLPEWYQLKTQRHPYQRTYREGVKAKWEKDDSYCSYRILDPKSEYYHGILEFTETAIYDFLMGNADRHHYETYTNAEKHGRLIHIDNGKTFGNPHHDEMSILAPLVQCCKLRASTWDTLVSFTFKDRGPLSNILDESLKRDPTYPVLTTEHLDAIDRRLEKVIQAVEDCIEKHGQNNVLISSWD